MIIDTHAHYDDEAFDTDREALLTSMYDGGIEKIVNVCASVGGFQDTVKLMEKYPFVYGAVGIHPDDADKMTQETLESFLDNKVFADQESSTLDPKPEGVAGFNAFMDSYMKGLFIERAAVESEIW